MYYLNVLIIICVNGLHISVDFYLGFLYKKFTVNHKIPLGDNSRCL